MDIFLTFINRWLGIALPRLFLLFLGVLLVMLVVTALWDRRLNKIGGAVGVLIGLFMVSIALKAGIAGLIGTLGPEIRIRLIAILFSVFLLVLTVVAWRKTGLQKRYGLTWTAVSMVVLLTALFPNLLHSFPSLLGVRYGLAIAGLFIIFLLLLVFHSSITLSELNQKQQEILQRIHQLERGGTTFDDQRQNVEKNVGLSPLRSITEKLPLQGVVARFIRRPLRGTSLAAPIIILVTVCSVFFVGLSAPQVMVGDEVTHYYMMVTQSQMLPRPNFMARIPTNWGAVDVRRYPHSFLWHYVGAILYRLSGGSFAIIQLYQALFLAQFLGVAYLLARSRRGVQTRSALPYLLILATIPMTLIFSVTFYQDVPMAAQVLTAFYLLRKNRWLLATFFICLALGIKVTAMLFFPAFFVCLFVWTLQRRTIVKTLSICCCSALLIGMCTWGLGESIKIYAGSEFYPVQKLHDLVSIVQNKIDFEKVKQPANESMKPKMVSVKSTKVISERSAAIIANDPGDLRIKANYFIYGGILLWLLVIAGGISFVLQRMGMPCKHPVRESTWWLWGVGLSYTLLVAFFLKTAPDARFFLPGLPFLLLPIAEKSVCLPRPKWLIALIASLAILQGGYVLAKTYHLRSVSPGLKEAISYLEKDPPVPRKIFMYPEGNYRLFPTPHEWYMNYHLRKFWRANDDTRLTMLHRYGIGAIVIKRYLVAPVDSAITNLGVYPDYFVREIQRDDRFKKVFENSSIIIYRVPAKKNEK